MICGDVVGRRILFLFIQVLPWRGITIQNNNMRWFSNLINVNISFGAEAFVATPTINRAILETYYLNPITDRMKVGGVMRMQQSSRAKIQLLYRGEAKHDPETESSFTSESKYERNTNRKNECPDMVVVETNDDISKKRRSSTDIYSKIDLCKDKNLSMRQNSHIKDNNRNATKINNFSSKIKRSSGIKKERVKKKIRKDYQNNFYKVPYSNYTVEELQELTENFMHTFQSSSLIDFTQIHNISETIRYVNHYGLIDDIEIMSRKEVRECVLLLSSWSKRRAPNSGLNAQKLLNKLINQIFFGNNNAYVTSITLYMVSSNVNFYNVGIFNLFNGIVSIIHYDSKNCN